MAKQFNMTSILLFVQSLPKAIQSQAIKSLPAAIPFEIKFGIFFALFIASYLSHRSYLHKKVVALENTVAELYKKIAILETQHDTLISKVDFMFTNSTYIQKALYKKLDFEDKYRDGKKEGNLLKNRQQANQEYIIAERTVARRFNNI